MIVSTKYHGTCNVFFEIRLFCAVTVLNVTEIIIIITREALDRGA